MGLLDRYVTNLTDESMGPYSLTEEDRKKLKKRGLLQLGLNLLATPTGQGGVFQAFGKSAVGAAQDVQQGGQDMMRQKYQADQMTRYKAEQDKQKQIDALAMKYKDPATGKIDMEGLRNEYMAIDPMKFINADAQGVQSSFQGADGNMYAIGRDGTVKNLNVKFNPSLQYKTDSNNQGFAFDKTTGAMAPVNSLPQQNQNVVQMPSYEPKAVRSQMQSIAMQFPDVKPSSFVRTPQRNAQVGGVPNSQHISGTAGDFVVPNATKPAFIQAARAKGFEAIDEGDHVHLELPPNTPRGAPAFRTPEDIEGAKAGAAASAKARVEAATAPQIAADVKIATDTAEAQAKKIINAPKVVSDSESMIGLLDKAINHPGRAASTGTSSMNPFNALPGSSTRDFSVLAEQIRGKTFLEAFNSLRGAGAITEQEGKAATAAIARLDMAQSEDEYLSALNELKGIVSRARDAALKPVGAQEVSAGVQYVRDASGRLVKKGG